MHADKIYLIIYYYKYARISTVYILVCYVSDNIPQCMDMKRIKKPKKLYLHRSSTNPGATQNFQAPEVCTEASPIS